MMQAADFGNRDDRAAFRRLNGRSGGCVLVERKVSARLVIVPEVAGQNAAQVAFAQHESLIEAIPTDRGDEALGEGVLPGAGGRGQDFTDSHPLHTLPECVAVDRVAIAEEVSRRGVVREGVHDLLGRR